MKTLIKATVGIRIKRRSRMVYDQVAADFLQVDLHQHPRCPRVAKPKVDACPSNVRCLFPNSKMNVSSDFSWLAAMGTLFASTNVG
jgi:hypothetical protein